MYPLPAPVSSAEQELPAASEPEVFLPEAFEKEQLIFLPAVAGTAEDAAAGMAAGTVAVDGAAVAASEYSTW